MARALFLPSSAEASHRWIAIDGDAIVARGEGVPDADDVPLTVIVPAEDVTLHWADVPARSTAQAVAAARLLVTDASAAPITDLHVAVGDEGEADRPIGVVAMARMRGWLAALAEQGLDPQAMIPAPMLLPRPVEGFVRADFGGDSVIRGTASGFADEPGLTNLVTGGVAPTVIDRDALEAAVVAAIARPTLDLRQGAFARRDAIAFDWGVARRAGWLVAAILLVVLAIALVEIAQYSFAADALTRKSDLIARGGLPRGETVNDAGRQLDARLVRLRGAGIGFSATAAVLFDAIRAVPGSELRALSFDATGKLRASLVTQNEGQVTDLINRIRARGLVATPSTFSGGSGRVSGDLTVTPR